MTADLLSRAGHLLWRDLPEEWRYRDLRGPDEPQLPAGEPGDLQAYLHGMGHLLDLIRGTTEQLHADSFSEPVDAGSGQRSIQTWALAYLAELVGAELVAPDPTHRVIELNNAVRWFKAKGTLASVDELADVVTGIETVTREGWRLVAVTPRPGLPPFTLMPGTEAEGARPAACPDFRITDRAVRDPVGSNPLYRLRFPRRDAAGVPLPAREVFWTARAPGGVPCFPGSYADFAARTPDLREPLRGVEVGPHPRRTLIHVRPPDGLFAEGLAEVAMAPGALPVADAQGRREIGVADVLAAAGPLPAVLPDRIRLRLSADLVVTAGQRLDLSGLLLVGPARLVVRPGGAARLSRSAVPVVVLEGPGPDDGLSLDAAESLFGTIRGGVGHARLEYVTVLDETDVTVLQASDCVLGTVTSNLRCTAAPGPGLRSCLRYTRVSPPVGTPCTAFYAGTNTVLPVAFQPRWFCPAGQPAELRLPAYGEPGCAVLLDEALDAIAAGAEDDGEMGVHHGHHHAAGLRALARKLVQFLPLGQDASLRYDPLLCLVPPTAQP
jgi:hypothetical protein